MPHGHNLRQQAIPINASALGTLGARTALALNSVMTSIKSTFLMIRYRYFLQLVGRTLADDGPVAILLARGDSTAAQVSAAMQENNTVGPEDINQVLGEDQTLAVYHNTVNIFTLRGDGTEGVLETGWRNFGGKNGIPALEDTGFTAHAFNMGSGSLTTGSSVNGLIYVQGVWLRD